MKKFAVAFIALVFVAGLAHAEMGPTEDDYRNFDQLRRKLVRMRMEMDKFMKDVIGVYGDREGGLIENLMPEFNVDVGQDDTSVIVKADLPGMEKDKIDITLMGNKILKIAGTRDYEKKETEPGMVRQERMRGSFERVFELPAECVTEGIKATYNNGVLEVVIPKKEKTKEGAVKISVQ